MTPHEQLRMVHSIEELSCRIARLAIGLGVSLKTDAEVVQAIHRHVDRRADLHAGHPITERKTHRHRQSYLYEELRGLLAMRYHMETHYVEVVGAFATRQILLDAESHLEHDGFQPGATGIDLDRLLKTN
jgi:hypothetical protein